MDVASDFKAGAVVTHAQRGSLLRASAQALEALAEPTLWGLRGLGQATAVSLTPADCR